MHIHIYIDSVRDLLEHIARISTKQASLPVLQCVLLEAKENTLTLKGTNLEVSIEGTCSAEVITEGRVAVSAQTFLQILTYTNEKKIECEVIEGMLKVKTKHSTTALTLFDIEEFPELPDITDEGVVVRGKNVAYGIKTAAIAAAPASIKPELGSVYMFQKKENTLTFVATDAFRLVEKTVATPNTILEDGILIPHKNALEIARILDIYDEDPKIVTHENQCAFTFSNMRIISRLTAGTFPDYQRMMPKEFSTHITFLKGDLVSALKKTGIFLNKFMQLTLTIQGGQLTLSSKEEVGSTEDTITISQEGGDITLSINQRYLQDILGSINEDSCVIHFTGVGRPLIIENVSDKTLRYLVMPMNR